MDVKIVDNIFNSVKSICGVSHLDDAFDNDLYLLTTGAISTVAQVIDIKPGFKFTVDSVWSDMIGYRMAADPQFHNVKTYTCINVKTIFDPGNGPTVQYHERYLSQELFRMGLAYDAYKAKCGGDVYKDDEILAKKAAEEARKKEHLSRLRGGVKFEQ